MECKKPGEEGWREVCHHRGSFIWSRASHGEHGDDHDDMNDGGDNRYVGPVMFYHTRSPCQGVVLFLEYNIMMVMLIRIEMMIMLV